MIDQKDIFVFIGPATPGLGLDDFILGVSDEERSSEAGINQHN
jgi:hypothetical protein